MRAFVTAAALFVALAPSLAHGTVVQLQAAKDNTLFEENGAASNGRGTGLFAGETSVGQKRRGLIGFDVSGIPAGSTINSVTLTMRMSRTSTGSEPVGLHFALSSWGEGTSNSDTMGGGGGAPATAADATWTHRVFSGALWNTPGGDFLNDPSAVAAVAGVGFYNWNGSGLVSDVQSWVNNSQSNAGWFVIGNETTNQTAKRFDTREAATIANRPVLQVDYTVPSPGVLCLLAGGLGMTVSGRRRCSY